MSDCATGTEIICFATVAHSQAMLTALLLMSIVTHTLNTSSQKQMKVPV